MLATACACATAPPTTLPHPAALPTQPLDSSHATASPAAGAHTPPASHNAWAAAASRGAGARRARAPLPPPRAGAAAASPGGGAGDASPPTSGSTTSFLAAFWKFLRPHTIRGTILGTSAVVSKALMESPEAIDWALLPRALLGLLALLCGNGYIVGINQIYDVDIDQVSQRVWLARVATLVCG